jgi:hypothetical protein
MSVLHRNVAGPLTAILVVAGHGITKTPELNDLSVRR